jgi:hypothetical protein
MTDEIQLIVSYIRQRAELNSERAAGSGAVAVEHGVAAAEFHALATDIVAGLHRA